MAQTTITAGDATSGGIVATGGNDGTMVLQTGPAGSKVNALAIDAAGTPTFIKQPIVPVQSMVRLNTANGYGSTNTKIRRFTNTVTNQGTDITYADSATLGASFTINTSGVYAISYSDQFSAQDQLGLSLNTTQPTIAIYSLTNASEILVDTSNTTANGVGCAAWTGYLVSGSVVRPHTGGVSSGSTVKAEQFTITRIA